MLIVSFFTNNGVPQAGLTPTIDIVNADTDTLVVNGAAMASLTQMTHCYIYNFAGAQLETNYVITVDGGAALPNVDRYQFGSNEDEQALFTAPVEGAANYAEMFRIMYAVLAGMSTGGGTAINAFRDIANSKDRVRAGVDAFGNRMSMVTDGT